MPVRRDARGQLELGGVDLATLARDPAIGTPTYVYDLSAMAEEARALHDAWDGAPHLVAYAVKANSAGPVVRALREAGCGADVVSGAELRVALACGVSPEDILFSGVAKRDDEIDAALSAGVAGIGAIQVESIEEGRRARPPWGAGHGFRSG
jgi:diaminopimelate decarboxylase